MSKKIFLIGFLIALSVLVFYVFKIHRVTVVVTDAITGEPIQDIVIFSEMESTGHLSIAGGNRVASYNEKEYKTDENGKVILDFGLRSKDPEKAGSFSVNSSSRLWSVNKRNSDKSIQAQSLTTGTKGINDKYFPKKYTLCNIANSFFCAEEDMKFLKFVKGEIKKIEVKLIPKLVLIEKCNDIKEKDVRDDCILFNSFYIATKEGDEKICLNIEDAYFKKVCEMDARRMKKVNNKKTE